MPPVKTPVRHLCFTAFVDEWKAPEPLPEQVRYVVWQLEQAPTSERPHYQGYVEFTKTVRVPQACSLLGLPRSTHFERREGTRDQARDYCRKEDTRLAGPWEAGTWELSEAGATRVRGMTVEQFLDEVRELAAAGVRMTYSEFVFRYPRFLAHARGLFMFAWNYLATATQPTMESLVLYQWQTDLIRHLKAAPQTRRIWWIWSRASSTGKSTFVQYLASTVFREKVLIAPWHLPSLMFMYDRHWIVAFNMPRDAQQEFLEEKSYLATLERLSDGGLMASTKYESAMKYVSAHIVVTANISPPYEKLPLRIVEICLDPGSLIRPHHPLAYSGPMPVIDSDGEERSESAHEAVEDVDDPPFMSPHALWP